MKYLVAVLSFGCAFFSPVAWTEGQSAGLIEHGLSRAQPETVGLDGKRLDRIDQFIESYVKEQRLPGAVYAISRHGKLARMGAAGEQHEDSLFRIYSMTKPVTVVATLILYEEGKFLLTDPVSLYLPEFANMQVYVDEQDGKTRTRPAERPITIEQLLTHTSGLSYDDDTVSGVPKMYVEADLWTVSSLAEFTTKLATLPLAFEPGTRWHYSVANDVLGRLVEVVAGQPFDQFLATRILAPLQMHDTAFTVPDDKLDRFVAMYQRDGESFRQTEAVADSAYRNPRPVPFGGSGLVSTASDYLRFAQMLLNGGELEGVRILGNKTVELMLMNHLGPDFSQPQLNESWVGRTENRSGEMLLGLGFGYGGYVITDVAQNAVPGSVGTYAWGGNSSTYFFIDPQEELIGIFLTQLSPSSSYPLRAQFRGLVYQAIVAE